MRGPALSARDRGSPGPAIMTVIPSKYAQIGGLALSARFWSLAPWGQQHENDAAYSTMTRRTSRRRVSKLFSAEHIGGDPARYKGGQEQRRQTKKRYRDLIRKVFHRLLPFTVGTFAEEYGRTAISAIHVKTY